MSEETKEILNKLLEYFKESNINDFGYEQDKLISYKEAQILLDYITNLQQKVEQLENIRKETIKFILQNCEIIRHEKENIDEVGRVNGADLLNILNKGSDK